MSTIATKPKCPQCSFSRFWRLRRSKFKCKRCRKEWSARTTRSGVRATPAVWQQAASLFLTRRTIRTLEHELGISHAQAAKLCHLFRVLMTADVPEPFHGISEADETFIGGQWKNKRRHIRARGTKKGHGTSKAPVVGVLNRATGHVRVSVLEKRSGTTYWMFIRACLAPDAVLYTDGYKMNRGVTAFGIAHDYVDHHRGEFARGGVHTNGIEGFWGYLKRQLATIGGIRRERLPLFVGEFAWRYNQRKLSHEARCERLLRLLKNDA